VWIYITPIRAPIGFVPLSIIVSISMVEVIYSGKVVEQNALAVATCSCLRAERTQVMVVTRANSNDI